MTWEGLRLSLLMKLITLMTRSKLIASHQARISNTYKGIERTDIDITPFGPEDIPRLTESKVKEYIAQ